MRVHLCGVRGSTPAPGPEFVRYGGHTSCLAVAHDGGPPRLMLDAGTGLRRAAALLDGPFDGTILLTHLHWDHVHGLPFFTAGDRPDARVTLLLPEQDGAASASSASASSASASSASASSASASSASASSASAEEVLARGMSPPHFPIGPGELRGRWSFGLLAAGELKAEGFTVEAAEIPHKGGRTFGYRVSDGHSVLAYLPDHGPVELGPGPEGWGEYHPAALTLAAGADTLVHDAFWLGAEATGQAMLGHTTADYAVELGRRAGVRRVVLAHHRPDRTDDELDRLAARFRADPGVMVAAEGTVIDLLTPARRGRRGTFGGACSGWCRAGPEVVVVPAWHAGSMDAYSSSSVPSRRASWIVCLARRIFYSVREMHYATKRASELMSRYGLAEPDQSPDTYAEFLLRTRTTVRHEPPAHRRAAGRPVR